MILEEKNAIWKEYRVFLLFFIPVALFIFLSVAYRDFYTTMRHGITFWDALFHFDLHHFYNYCAEGGIGHSAGPLLYSSDGNAAYDITIYAIFAIWNFPMWIIEKCFAIDVQNTFWGAVYGKTMILLFLMYSAKQVREIGLLLPQGKQYLNEIVIAYLSSVLVLMYVVASGNYDVITVAFVLRGIRAYLQKDMKRFFLAFIIANTIKYLSLFLFVPLLLLKYKKIAEFLRAFGLGIMLIIIEKLFFAIGGSSPVNLASGALSAMFVWQVGNFSLLFLAYSLIVFWAWKTDSQEEDKQIKDVVFAGFLTYGSLIFFGQPYPYWSIFFVPFAILEVFMVMQNVKLGVLLETLLTLLIAVDYYIRYPWVPDDDSCINMLIYQLIGKRIYTAKGSPTAGFSVGTVLHWINDHACIRVGIASMGVVCFSLIVFYSVFQKERTIKGDYQIKMPLKKMLAIRGTLTTLTAVSVPLLYLVQMLFYDYVVKYISPIFM